jgi:hypothetical protein
MTGNPRMFTSLDENVDEQDKIIFGDKSMGNVQGLGKMAISNDLFNFKCSLGCTIKLQLVISRSTL